MFVLAFSIFCCAFLLVIEKLIEKKLWKSVTPKDLEFYSVKVLVNIFGKEKNWSWKSFTISCLNSLLLLQIYIPILQRMGGTPSVAFHDFSSDEKAEISRVLQSKYLDLKENDGASPDDTLLFEALKT